MADGLMSDRPVSAESVHSGRPLGDLRPTQPKFRLAADRVRRALADGTWPPGTRLPAEASLAREMGVSINTVRRALQELSDRGLLQRRQGAGTFVSLPGPKPVRARRTIGVLLPESAVYFAPVLHGIRDAARAGGARLVVRCSRYRPDRDLTLLDELLTAGVDGLLVTPSAPQTSDSEPLARRLAALPVPVVYVERRWSTSKAADVTEHVYSHHEGGAYDAVRHLHGLGHRRIALLVRSGATPSGGVAAGFRQAVADLGLSSPVQLEWSQHVPDPAARADRALEAVVAAACTALVCFGDPEARTVVAAARRRGLALPGRLAMVSYGDESATEVRPALTAVAPEKYRMGVVAAEFLLRRLEDPAGALHQLRLRPRLLIRDSCAGAPPPVGPAVSASPS